MTIQAGQVLRSCSSETDDYFYEAIVYITEHNEKGSLGFVTNRPFPRSLNELTEFAHLLPFPLCEGGPVDGEHLYFLHRRPDLIEDGMEVLPGVYFGGDFKQAAEAMENGTITTADIRLFIGYCGWDTGDLETEMKEGGWKPTEAVIFM